MVETTVRDRAEIEAEIAAARQRLAGNLEGLINRVHPKAIVSNKVAEVRSFADSSFRQVKAQLVDADGRIQTRPAVLLAAAVGGAAAFVVIVRSLLSRR